MTPLAARCRKCLAPAAWRIRSSINDRVIDVCRTHADCLMHRIDKGEASIVIAPAGYLPCVAGCFRWIGNDGRAAHQCSAPRPDADHSDACLDSAATAAFENHMVDRPYGPDAVAAGRNLIEADLHDCHC